MVDHCDTCQAAANFEIVASYGIIPDDEPPCEYTFGKCDGCGKPAVFVREDYGGGFDDANPYYRMYPPQSRRITFLLPAIVESSYKEAVQCERFRLSTACAVMVGRTLEAVCRDQLPGKLPLLQSLKKLATDGAISNEIFEWADALRVVRNSGAHPAEGSVDAADASEGLDFLQAILEIFYDLRPKFTKMKQRHSGANA